MVGFLPVVKGSKNRSGGGSVHPFHADNGRSGAFRMLAAGLYRKGRACSFFFIGVDLGLRFIHESNRLMGVSLSRCPPHLRDWAGLFIRLIFA